jgi:hypothetical protein
MRQRLTVVLATLALALALAAPASATPPAYAGAQARYWWFSDGNDLRDLLAYWVPGPFHVTLEVWDFLDPGTQDQFRPEVGLHLRDRRRSVYTVQWRHEKDQERYWLSTDQVLGPHVVGRVELSPIVSRTSTLLVASTGLDYYWGSWNFATLTLIRDPRQAGLWIVPLRVRFANEANDWVQATLAPASESTIGWALDAKKGWVRFGIERNNRYDFTHLDNTIVTLGAEFPLHIGR